MEKEELEQMYSNLLEQVGSLCAEARNRLKEIKNSKEAEQNAS